MRIIDKNTDFYDYLQNMYKDDTFTFDRSNSFLLTKDILCGYLTRKHYSLFKYSNDNSQYDFLLLQICNTFWLFSVQILYFDDYGRATRYKINLLCQWKNYNKPRLKYKLSVISFSYSIRHQVIGRNYWSSGYTDESLLDGTDILKQAVDLNEFKTESVINDYIVYQEYKGDYKKIQKEIPLLKACGIAELIEALDVYNSLEEYFSLEKSDSERIEAIGTTNNDKIVNHGFDLKTSFRGKNK